MFSTSKLEEWRRLTKTEPILEDGRTVAGQQAEVFLKSLVKNNLKYKGAYCFAGKRVPSRQHKRRFELDLIVWSCSKRVGSIRNFKKKTQDD